MAAIASNLPAGRKTYTDQNGAPLAGGSVTYFQPGTSNLVTIYLDDAQTLPATNPVILDAAGSCVSFAVGEFREYVQDANGNLISDSVVVASTPLTINASMLPVLQAQSVAEAESILTGAGGGGGGTGSTHLELKPADQSITVAPTGNFPATLASLNVQGDAASATQREFMVNFGMTSATGKTGIGTDKVTLYTGIVGNAGTSDIWSQNPLLTMGPNSGSYNAQCIEVDFNNTNAHRGSTGTLTSDFSAPIANGVSITGAGLFSSTTGLAIVSESGNAVPQWNRGITTVGTMGICAFQEWSSCPVGIQFDGAYSIAAINLTSAYNNAGAATETALFLKAGQTITWQTPDKLNVISDTVDVNNNRVIGLGSMNGGTPGIFMGGSTLPVKSGLQLGSASNRWGDIWAANCRLENTMVVSWDNNPAANGGVAGFVFDYVDNTNSRVVGGSAQTVYMGAQTVPITSNLNLGTNDTPWGSVYSSVGIVTPSDPALKTEITGLTNALHTVEQIAPIAFRWRDGPDDKLHYGFNASEIKATMPSDFGGHVETNGVQHLVKEELLGVMWQAMREMAAKIKLLEDR